MVQRKQVIFMKFFDPMKLKLHILIITKIIWQRQRKHSCAKSLDILILKARQLI